MNPQNSDHQFWSSNWAKRDGSPNPFVQVVLEYIPNHEGKSLLDLGCGDGRDAMFFADKGFSVTAVDYSESGIEKLESSRSDIRVFRHDIRKLAFPNDTFDVIYAHLSLHYFDDQTTREIFVRIRNTLRPGGFFFVKCKSIDDPLYGKGEKIAEDTFVFGHTRHFFSERYFRDLLAEFSIVALKKSLDPYEDHQSAFIEAIARKD